jgi:hypothetical protein
MLGERPAPVKYSLASLMMVMLLGGPGLAGLWWLRHTWFLQVLFILALMTTAVCIFCAAFSALIAAGQRLANSSLALRTNVSSRNNGPRDRTRPSIDQISRLR